MQSDRATPQQAFGRTIRDRREAQGLSQEALAAKAGLHRTYLADVERGGRNPSLLSIVRIARGLNVAAAVLFERVDRLHATEEPASKEVSDGHANGH